MRDIAAEEAAKAVIEWAAKPGQPDGTCAGGPGESRLSVLEGAVRGGGWGDDAKSDDLPEFDSTLSIWWRCAQVIEAGNNISYRGARYREGLRPSLADLLDLFLGAGANEFREAGVDA